MGSLDEQLLEGGDYLEAQILSNPISHEGNEEDGGRIIYRASFQELENAYVNYDTVQWVLIALVFVLVYGVGLLLLLYVPIRRYIVRRDIRTRELYITTQAVVYKVKKPVILPCCGVSMKEKHVLLHLVTDMTIEEGWLQSCFGVSTVRVENAKLGWPAPGNELWIQGVVDPRLFKKVVLMASAKLRQGQIPNGEDNGLLFSPTDNGDVTTPPEVSQIHPSQPWSWQQGVSWQMTYPNTLQRGMGGTIVETPITGEAILHKLDTLETSIKRIEVLIGQRDVSTSR
ncbi:unnamed protein product [Sphagnum jensenii]|uniref:DUF7642 domain-containing protein n=1 Tax=Sphagnum jensenii TaxID=128206 RepID=A0ABP0VV89_9BRYO